MKGATGLRRETQNSEETAEILPFFCWGEGVRNFSGDLKIYRAKVIDF